MPDQEPWGTEDNKDFWQVIIVILLGFFLFLGLWASLAHGSVCFLPEGCTTSTVTKATEDMLIVYRGPDVVAASLDGDVCVGTVDAPECHRAIPALEIP